MEQRISQHNLQFSQRDSVGASHDIPEKNPPDFLKNLRIRLQSAEKYDILKKITPCHCRDKPNYTPNEKR